MKEVIARATALRAVMIDADGDSAPQHIAEAAVSCLSDLMDAGEFTMADEVATDAAVLVPAAGQAWELRLGLVKSKALRMLGRFEDAYKLTLELSTAHEELLKGLKAEAWELRIAMATNMVLLNRVEEATDQLLAVRKELLSSPDSALLAQCAFQLSSAQMYRGDLTAARRYVLEAIVSARRASVPVVEALGLDNLGKIERALCRWSSSIEATTDALSIFERLGSRFYGTNVRRSLAIVYWKKGDLDKSVAMASTCADEATKGGDGLVAWYATLLKGLALLHAGRFDEASSAFRLDPSWETPRTHSRASLLTTEFLGDVYLEQGDPDKAIAYYGEVWPKAMALVPKGDIVAELRRRRAECHYLQGAFESAYEEAKRGLGHCRELGDRYEEAATYRVLALSAAAIGKHDEARRWFDQGFAYYDDIETPYEWGKLWMAYGDWLRGPHAGPFADSVASLEAYHAARDHFERMGACLRLAEANARIADIVTQKTAELSAKIHAAKAAASEAKKPQHARRRPRAATEIERRSEWARNTFGLVTRNKQMLHMLEDVEKLAASKTPILVLGESGTGKELVAGGIHAISGRKGAYVPINCSALPREMIESELFGHVSGSFTGATKDKAGLVEVCDGGTVFLDEIAEMPAELQSRLLRFLEEGETRRIGSNRNVAVDTRIVAATNRERSALENGRGFRPDLYYRLAHAVVTLPPLRRRGDDVELLIEHFLAGACAEESKEVALSDAALDRLKKHSWPGNVRQLRATIKRVVLLASPDEDVQPSSLQLDEGKAPVTLLEEMALAEKQRIGEALAQARGSRTEAAKYLGMPRTTFINKMKRFGLS